MGHEGTYALQHASTTSFLTLRGAYARITDITAPLSHGRIGITCRHADPVGHLVGVFFFAGLDMHPPPTWAERSLVTTLKRSRLARARFTTLNFSSIKRSFVSSLLSADGASRVSRRPGLEAHRTWSIITPYSISAQPSFSCYSPCCRCWHLRWPASPLCDTPDSHTANVPL